MATLHDIAEDYFSSMNPLAKKVMEDRSQFVAAQGEAWLGLSGEERESLLDTFNNGPADAVDLDTPEVFPRYRLKCGEKIMVDFDSEVAGWTWRDEHSAPFSWETRSQNELSLFDEEDGEAPEKTRVQRTPKLARKARSPDPEDSRAFAFKPEKSIWDSPFLKGEVGFSYKVEDPEKKDADDTVTSEVVKAPAKALVSPDPDSAGSPGQEDATLEQTNQLFKTFDMAMGNHVTVTEPAPYDVTHGDDISLNRVENAFDKIINSDSCSTLQTDSRTSTLNSRSMSGSVTSRRSSTSTLKASPERRGSRLRGLSLRKLLSPRRSHAPRDAQELRLDLHTDDVTQDRGQLSPVYIADPGESFTDYEPGEPSRGDVTIATERVSPSAADTPSSLSPRDSDSLLPPPAHFTSAPTGGVPPPQEQVIPRDLGEVNLGLDDSSDQPTAGLTDQFLDWNSPELATNQLQPDTKEDHEPPKTGFDFLDNW